jgi:hypothetical protein
VGINSEWSVSKKSSLKTIVHNKFLLSSFLNGSSFWASYSIIKDIDRQTNTKKGARMPVMSSFLPGSDLADKWHET